MPGQLVPDTVGLGEVFGLARRRARGDQRLDLRFRRPFYRSNRQGRVCFQRRSDGDGRCRMLKPILWVILKET